MAANPDMRGKLKDESGPPIKTEKVLIEESEEVNFEIWMEQKEESSVLTESTHNLERKAVNLEVVRVADSNKGGKALYIDHPLTTQRFNDIQARLGYDQPSKVLDWLMDAAASASASAIPIPIQKHQSQLEEEDPDSLLFSWLERIDKLHIQKLPRDGFEAKELDTTLSLWWPVLGGSSTSNPTKDEETELPRNSTKPPSTSRNSSSLWHSSVGSNVCESYASNSTRCYVDKEFINCLLYCDIFPKDYEIDKDTLIQLWMAAGFITNEPMEDVAVNYLQGLECKNVISILRKDPFSGKEWYKINDFPFSEYGLSRISHVRMDAGSPTPLSTTQGGPCHVTVQDPSTDFEMLKKFARMRTLLFLDRHGSCFERVPDNFFISLKHLETLDLSETRLSELSSSIGNAKSLRYLDLSHTLIKQLPETIGCLHFLQTLKLLKCPRLIALPKGITKLIRLRHLEFDTPCRTCLMPPGMGALSSLRTLLEFPVSAEHGCTIQELTNMNELRGSLCLSRLESITSLDEAREANLCSKQWLKKMELRWSSKKHRNTKSDDDIITYLRPHMNLQDLRILCYGGSAFPTWISDPSFVNLVSITLFKCENCRLLPSLGQLPSLVSLSLYELTAVRTVDFHFCRDIAIADGNNVAFPRLQKLEIISMLNLEDMRDPEKWDFPSLVEMTIKDCPKLVALWRILGIHSFKYLELSNCPMLPSLPEENLSIETLVIEGCPLLGSSCSKEDGQDWHKIVHVPNVFIDQLKMPSSSS